MQATTLVLLRGSDGKWLLGRKKRGFGRGKWNGFGGKIRPQENVKDAALRELKEESGLLGKAEDLVKVAYLEFLFKDDPSLNHPATVYLLERYEGTPRAGEEMEPQWFAPDAIPYDNMWPADRYWWPAILDGQKLTGKIVFAKDDEVLAYQLREVEHW